VKGKKVLIVDDNPQMSSLLKDILEVFNYKGVLASDGDEALATLKKSPCDLVITDLKMPKMSGIDLLTTIKQSFPQIPVVVITGFGVNPQNSQLITDQADGYLNKPFKVEEIEKLLKKILYPES
jgi:two-component system response regulator AtoC